ncbi:basic phospholipase A2 taipoxin alpha chain-like isoform X2 [Ptychodera flava]|uniref:basic phospholipase A2 taipoxin alpha chain-like isoform X2 n=1 Tax=Ptychodera flava TaxID=63121 RepID=UPI003969D4C0
MAFRTIARYQVLGFFLGLCFLTTRCFAEEGNTERDGKLERTVGTKSILQFGAMILCATGRNPLDYNNYGCYCGLGGSGTAVDGVDRCCEAHDRCYRNAISNSGCPSWYIYVATYKFECTTCRPRSSYLFMGKCKHAICRCDSVAARCFARNTYNSSYKGHDKSNC